MPAKYAAIALCLRVSCQCLFRIPTIHGTHSSPDCRSVSIAFMAAQLEVQAGSPLAATMHYRDRFGGEMFFCGVWVRVRSLGERQVR